MNQVINCAQCKTTFVYNRTHGHKRKYCSKKCKSEYLHLKDRAKLYYQNHKVYFSNWKKVYYKNHKQQHQITMDRYNRTPKGRFDKARSEAKHRNLEFTLTLEHYTEIIKNPCYYCGDLLVGLGYWLDRIDSSKGYYIDNVRPCCFKCNHAKSDMREDVFFLHIFKISQKHFDRQQLIQEAQESQ